MVIVGVGDVSNRVVCAFHDGRGGGGSGCCWGSVTVVVPLGEKQCGGRWWGCDGVEGAEGGGGVIGGRGGVDCGGSSGVAVGGGVAGGFQDGYIEATEFTA